MSKKSSIDPTLLKKIKDEYIYGIIDETGKTVFQSYDKLAEKYNVSSGTLKRLSNPEEGINWTAKRKQYRTKSDLKTIEKKSEITASEIVQSDDKFMDTAEKLRQGIDLKAGLLIEDLNDPERSKYVRSSDFKNLGDGLVSCQNTIKTAQGEITDRIKIESQQDIKVTILDDNFMNKELEFAKELIDNDR